MKRFVLACLSVMALFACGLSDGEPLANDTWLDRIEREQALAAEDSRFAPRIEQECLVLETPGSTVARFSPEGARLRAGGREVSLHVSAIGRDGAPVELSPTPSHVVSGPEVRATLAAGIVEWWRSLPSGLEHGITLAERPAGDGPLRIEVEALGDLSPRLRSPDAVELRAATGEVALTYAHLFVVDATGARIPSHMSVEDGRIELWVSDERARYPLVVDPLVAVEEATLAAASPANNDHVGRSVSLSADGATAMVAGETTLVFSRSGTTWTLDGALPVSSTVVALSADASRAIIRTASVVQVLVRSGTAWINEASLPWPRAAPDFGAAIALSGDASRAAIAAPSDTVGSVVVYVRSSTTWTVEASLEPSLAPHGGAGALAMSRDGTRVVCGLPDSDRVGGTDSGRIHVYLRTGGTWALEAMLDAPSSAPNHHFGTSVAISADGARLVGGAPSETGAGGDGGFATVFRHTAMWGWEGTLRAPDATPGDLFGTSVAISDGARIIVVGVPGDDAARGSVRAFTLNGAAWSHEGSFVAPDVLAVDRHGSAVAISDAGTRVLEGAPDDDVLGQFEAGSARVFTLRATPGVPCAVDDECASGFCTDGVCCNTRCPGDCEQCGSGMCTPLTPATVCRASAGGCDPAAELCTGLGGSCPADVRSSAGTTCRAVAGLCDVAEICDGGSAACPADALLPALTECRAAATTCDAAEVCDGATAACPASGSSGVRISGHVCRMSGGLCDVPEVCDGVTTTCPGDVLFSAGATCGGMAGTCASTGMCTGTSAVCVGSVPLAAGAVCLSASAANPCDVNDTCDGTSTTCPPSYAPATTVCNDLLTGICDAPDRCAGTSADCIPTFLSGVECRAGSGGCDGADFCSGASPVCPPDSVEPAGMTCRASIDLSCDPVEVCDGVASTCPLDVTTCSDAGPRDGGAPGDAASDAGSAPSAVATCGCRASGSRPGAVFVVGLALALALRRRRTL